MEPNLYDVVIVAIAATAAVLIAFSDRIFGFFGNRHLAGMKRRHRDRQLAEIKGLYDSGQITNQEAAAMRSVVFETFK